MKAVQIPLIALCSLSFSYSAEIEKSLAAAKNPIRLSEISFVAEAYKDEK